MCLYKIIPFFYFFIFLSLTIPFHLSLPFYSLHDMDHITLIDLLCLNSGQHPVHLIHPGAGMFFVLHWMERVFNLFSLSPIISFSDLKNSLEPMLIVANKVTYLRWVHHVALISIMACLFYFIRKIQKGWPFFLSGTLYCFSMQFFWYFNPSRLRTETFSILFFSIAVAIIGYEFSRKNKNFLNYIFIILFLSLCYITKIQALFIIMTAFIFLIFFYPKEVLPIKNPSLVLNRWNFAFIILLSILSLSFEIDAMVRHKYFKLNYVGLFLLFLLVFCSIKKIKTQNNLLNYFYSSLSIHLPLCTTIFISTVFLSSTTMNSINGLFVQFFIYIKIIFFRFYDEIFTKWLLDHVNPMRNLKIYWPYLILVGILFIGNTYNFYCKKRVKEFMCYILISLLLIFNILIGTRSSAGDSIWNHVFIFIFIFSSLRIFLDSTSSLILKRSMNLLVLLISIFLTSKYLPSFLKRPLYTYHDYDRFFQEVYTKKRTSIYRKTMNEAYPNSNKRLFLKRRLLRPFRYSLSLYSLFPKEKFSILDVSIPYKGSFLVRDQNEKKLLVQGCPQSICDGYSFVVSSKKRKGSVSITIKKDTKIYAIRSKKTKNTKCQKLKSKGENVFFYDIKCYNSYKIDSFHKGFIVVENT